MILFVVTTLPDEQIAADIIRNLVEKKAAACGTIIPGAHSIYRWKGAIEEAKEVIVVFKIPKSAAASFEADLRALHPYEIPEIASFEPSQVSQSFTTWALAACDISAPDISLQAFNTA